MNHRINYIIHGTNCSFMFAAFSNIWLILNITSRKISKVPSYGSINTSYAPKEQFRAIRVFCSESNKSYFITTALGAHLMQCHEHGILSKALSSYEILELFTSDIAFIQHNTHTEILLHWWKNSCGRFRCNRFLDRRCYATDDKVGKLPTASSTTEESMYRRKQTLVPLRESALNGLTGHNYGHKNANKVESTYLWVIQLRHR
jgi:hypothetical protein